MTTENGDGNVSKENESETSQVRVDFVGEVIDLKTRAEKGDQEAVAKLQVVLRKNPMLWMESGNLASTAQRSWIAKIAGVDAYFASCIAHSLEDERKKLVDDSASREEHLLVEQLILCRLQLRYYELLEAQQDETAIRWAQFREKKLEAAYNRYMKTMAMLKTVQTLRPVVPMEAAIQASPVPEETAIELKFEKLKPGDAGNGSTPENNAKLAATELMLTSDLGTQEQASEQTDLKVPIGEYSRNQVKAIFGVN